MKIIEFDKVKKNYQNKFIQIWDSFNHSLVSEYIIGKTTYAVFLIHEKALRIMNVRSFVEDDDCIKLTDVIPEDVPVEILKKISDIEDDSVKECINILESKGVSVSNAQPGDLLIHSDLSHVGMYIGNGQQIESLYSGQYVRIVSVPWSKIGYARRVL